MEAAERPDPIDCLCTSRCRHARHQPNSGAVYQLFVSLGLIASHHLKYLTYGNSISHAPGCKSTQRVTLNFNLSTPTTRHRIDVVFFQGGGRVHNTELEIPHVVWKPALNERFNTRRGRRRSCNGGRRDGQSRGYEAHDLHISSVTATVGSYSLGNADLNTLSIQRLCAKPVAF